MNTKFRTLLASALALTSFAFAAAPAAAKIPSPSDPPTSPACTNWIVGAKQANRKALDASLDITTTVVADAVFVYTTTLEKIEMRFEECNMALGWFSLLPSAPAPAGGPPAGPAPSGAAVLPVTGASADAPMCFLMTGVQLNATGKRGVTAANANIAWTVPVSMTADQYDYKYVAGQTVQAGASTLFCDMPLGVSQLGNVAFAPAPAGGPPAGPAPSGAAGPSAAPAVSCAIPAGITLLSQTGTMAKISAPGPFTVPAGWAVDYRGDKGLPKYRGGQTVPVTAGDGYEATLWSPESCKGLIH